MLWYRTTPSRWRLRLERRPRSSRGKCRPEHGQAANGRFLCRFVLDDVPVLGKSAFLEAHDIHHNPLPLASRGNVRAVLNVVRRPETLRSGVVPLVEKRFESLQHESLILFLDCLRHFILLRYTLQTRPCGGSICLPLKRRKRSA